MTGLRQAKRITVSCCNVFAYHEGKGARSAGRPRKWIILRLTANTAQSSEFDSARTRGFNNDLGPCESVNHKTIRYSN
jgi:hypothetical protein